MMSSFWLLYHHKYLSSYPSASQVFSHSPLRVTFSQTSWVHVLHLLLKLWFPSEVKIFMTSLWRMCSIFQSKVYLLSKTDDSNDVEWSGNSSSKLWADMGLLSGAKKFQIVELVICLGWFFSDRTHNNADVLDCLSKKEAEGLQHAIS